MRKVKTMYPQDGYKEGEDPVSPRYVSGRYGPLSSNPVFKMVTRKVRTMSP
jgi:hypothetical protein